MGWVSISNVVLTFGKWSFIILQGFLGNNAARGWVAIEGGFSFEGQIDTVSSCAHMPHPLTKWTHIYQRWLNNFLIYTTLQYIEYNRHPINHHDLCQYKCGYLYDWYLILKLLQILNKRKDLMMIERKTSEHPDEEIKPQYMNLPVIMYLKQKCGLPQSEIESRLKKGSSFEIKGEGNQLDSGLIEQVLIQNDFYEKLSQKQLKDQSMKFVKHTIEEWSLNIARNQKKINKDQLPNYMAKVLPFGSHVLDLRSNSSDIDLVCVVPNFVNRQTHFFQGLASRFQKDPEVKGLSVRRIAQVPIITFDYKEINIDISFCRLEEETIPRDIQRVINMDLINKIGDEQSKTSIIGRKNNLMILELAGPAQLENFKQTLRIIKVWAKNRGISSNVMGFLGGISWAIMLAKICQIFPHHRPSKLLAEFFNIYKLWRWKEMAVALIQPEKQVIELMTVLTPCNHYNSTRRVNRITFEVIEKQIARASQILMYKRADFQTLCQKLDFTSSFNFFLEIDVCGKGKTREQEKQYKDFLGSVEAKILNLLTSIINNNKKDLDKSLKIVPNPKSYKKNDPAYDYCNVFFLGIKLTAAADLTRAVSEWCNNLDKERAGKEGLNVRIFECFKEDFATDVEINEVPKKAEKQDPRLAMRARRT